MQRYNDDQLNEKIATFLSKKYQKYPDLGTVHTAHIEDEKPRMSDKIAHFFESKKSLIINY